MDNKHSQQYFRPTFQTASDVRSSETSPNDLATVEQDPIATMVQQDHPGSFALHVDRNTVSISSPYPPQPTAHGAARAANYSSMSNQTALSDIYWSDPFPHIVENINQRLARRINSIRRSTQTEWNRQTMFQPPHDPAHASQGSASQNFSIPEPVLPVDTDVVNTSRDSYSPVQSSFSRESTLTLSQGSVATPRGSSVDGQACTKDGTHGLEVLLHNLDSLSSTHANAAQEHSDSGYFEQSQEFPVRTRLTPFDFAECPPHFTHDQVMRLECRCVQAELFMREAGMSNLVQQRGYYLRHQACTLPCDFSRCHEVCFVRLYRKHSGAAVEMVTTWLEAIAGEMKREDDAKRQAGVSMLEQA